MLCFALFRNDPHLVAVRAGKPLFVEGDPPGLMYVLVKGNARILIGNREVEQLELGGVVGEMSLVERLPHSVTVEALSDCEFACVDEKRFNFLVAETPGFAMELMRVLAHRLRATHNGRVQVSTPTATATPVTAALMAQPVADALPARIRRDR